MRTLCQSAIFFNILGSKELLKNLKSKLKGKYKLILIVGGGIQKVNQLQTRNRIRELNGLPPTPEYTRDEDSLVWPYYESARYHSFNTVPAAAYYYIYKLIQAKYVDSIISTNYDLFLESIFQKCNLISLTKLNPIRNKGEDDQEQYFSLKLKSAETKISFYKMHGSFSHIIFDSCRTLFRCPNFISPYPVDNSEYNLYSLFHFHMNNTANGRIGKKTHISIRENCIPVGHYIDNNFSDRSLFLKEIEAAKMQLKSTKNIAGILLIGFRGWTAANGEDETWNEEIVEDIEDHLFNGIPVIQFLSPEQGEKEKTLLSDIILKNKSGLLLKGSIEKNLGETIAKISVFKRYSMHKEYLKEWVG